MQYCPAGQNTLSHGLLFSMMHDVPAATTSVTTAKDRPIIPPSFSSAIVSHLPDHRKPKTTAAASCFSSPAGRSGGVARLGPAPPFGSMMPSPGDDHAASRKESG
jgi:hypothetical protein